MRKQAVALVLVVTAAMPAAAAELVLFVDGRYLEVRSHEEQGEAIRLRVAPDSFVVVPRARIEWIRDPAQEAAAPPRATVLRVTPTVGEAEPDRPMVSSRPVAPLRPPAVALAARDEG